MLPIDLSTLIISFIFDELFTGFFLTDKFTLNFCLGRHSSSQNPLIGSFFYTGVPSLSCVIPDKLVTKLSKCPFPLRECCTLESLRYDVLSDRFCLSFLSPADLFWEGPGLSPELIYVLPPLRDPVS